jgi:CHAT domain-containing protein
LSLSGNSNCRYSNIVPSDPFLVASPDYDLCLPQFADSNLRGEDRVSSSLHNAVGPYLALASSHIESAVLFRYFGVPIIRAGQATEGYMKSHCRHPRILHLSTHGEFEGEGDVLHKRHTDETDVPENSASINPLLRSWLVMAGANSWIHNRPVPDEVEDGKLTAEDVTGLDLIGTDLVVLSACQSGLGGVIPGEGVFGLRRAFLQAGAKTLLVSLWSVEGLSTAWLIEHFYQSLLQYGEDRDQALRSAQQATRKAQAIEVLDWLEGLDIPMTEQKERLLDARIKQWKYQLKRMPLSHNIFKHPYYWSGFICIGEVSPICLN